MNQVNTRINFTHRDYRSLPESDTRRYELLEGELALEIATVLQPRRGGRRSSAS